LEISKGAFRICGDFHLLGHRLLDHIHRTAIGRITDDNPNAQNSHHQSDLKVTLQKLLDLVHILDLQIDRAKSHGHDCTSIQYMIVERMERYSLPSHLGTDGKAQGSLDKLGEEVFSDGSSNSRRIVHEATQKRLGGIVTGHRSRHLNTPKL